MNYTVASRAAQILSALRADWKTCPMAYRHHLKRVIRRKADRSALRSLNLSTLDDVWRKVGENLDGLDPLVHAGADRTFLVRDLMDSAARDAVDKGTSWPRRHFLELLLVSAALGLWALLSWAIPRASSAGIALHPLRAGEQVGAESLQGAAADRFADRRLTRDVPQGDYVRPEWLAPIPALADQDLRGRYRISLHLPSEDLKLLPTLPARVTLAVSTVKDVSPQALLLSGIPVLAAEKGSDKATVDVALTEVELRALLPLLSRIEIRVVRPVL